MCTECFAGARGTQHWQGLDPFSGPVKADFPVQSLPVLCAALIFCEFLWFPLANIPAFVLPSRIDMIIKPDLVAVAPSGLAYRRFHRRMVAIDDCV